jgi:prophage regulatory protein
MAPISSTAATQQRLLRLREVCSRTGLARSTIYARLTPRGDFPAPIKLGERAVAWPEQAINEWIASRIAAASAPAK